MGVILELPARAPEKFGHKRVRKHRKQREMEKAGQMNLFAGPARIHSMPSRLSPFDQALLLDDRGSHSARELYQAAIEANDYAADAYCNLGIIESREGRIDEAFECFTRSLQLEPAHFESHYNIANLFFDVRELRSACFHYRMAERTHRDYPNLYFNLGLVLAMENDFDGSLRALSRYRQLVPSAEGHIADGLIQMIEESLAGE